MTHKSPLNNLLNFLYPPMCQACRRALSTSDRLCKDCKEHFQLLPLEGHCQKCFAEIPYLKGACKPCRSHRHPFKRVGACFDAYGPGKSLLKDPDPKDLAPFYLIQLERLQFPRPDLITDLPGYFSRSCRPLAKEVAKQLGTAYQPTLNRIKSPKPTFALKKKCNIINKVVLLLHTEIAEREEFRFAGWAIKEGLPEQLWGIGLCAILH
jgi:hypothetical protein